ncbi:MAG: hypothetical protein HMLKMBBP_00512 [Planctomycetes bacterium]|nr:hypothetical protein [Planctomycetota bacterium]
MRFARAFLACAAALVAAGCGDAPKVIGRAGLGDGEFTEPRGIAVSADGLAVLDRSGRAQVFDLDGRWTRTVRVVPSEVRRGLPIGCAWRPGGVLAVAHTHESRIVFFDDEGHAVSGFGKEGTRPGEFLMPQRVTVAADGRLWVCDHGFLSVRRVQVLEPDGTPVRIFGGPEPEHGGLGRPMAALPLADGRCIVADQRAGLAVFDAAGAYVGPFAAMPDRAVVQGACLVPEGERAGDVLCVDLQRSEIRRYAPDGSPLGTFAAADAPERPLREPWDIAWHAGFVYVADMGNHRVVRIPEAAIAWTAR